MTQAKLDAAAAYVAAEAAFVAAHDAGAAATHTIAIDAASGMLFAEVDLGQDIQAEIGRVAAGVGYAAPDCLIYNIFWASAFDDAADAFRDPATIVYRGDECAVKTRS